MIKISSSFDAGNIDVLSTSDIQDIQLNIRKDSASDHFQWFYFRVQGALGKALKMRILNASESTFPDGWDGYQALASYDRKTWFRVPSHYKNGEFIIDIDVQQNSAYIAYFTPYSYERHLDLLAWAESNANCYSENIGSSCQNRDMTMLTIGSSDENAKKIWIIARQHPAETMAEWFIEGLLKKLLDPNDGMSQALLQQTTFYIVPNMNPDGSVLGNLRTNANGTDLNRAWLEPSKKNSPEVLCVQMQMEKTGCDLFLDIHGDESRPYNYLIDQKEISTSEKVLELEDNFQHLLLSASAEYQMTRSYTFTKFGVDVMSIGSVWVGNQFECPSMTLEMPFIDNEDRISSEFGWSAQRSQLLGQSMLQPIYHILPQLD